jgi:hypothetical protein
MLRDVMSMTATRTAPTTAAMHTMAKTFEEIQGRVPGYPWVPLGNFMMDFFRNFPDRREELLADPIQVQQQLGATSQDEGNAHEEMHRWAVFCAASVEYLAHCYGLVCPTWVQNYTEPLPDPWYFAPMAYKKPQVRARIEQQTPPEFACRNIYCGSRVYVDKYAEAQQFIRQTA